MGLPVICLDHLGFRDAVDPSCGIRIPVRALNQVVDDFARAIEVLARNEDPRHARALAAREASKHLTWRHKARVLFDSYEQIISACEKPLYQIQPLENPANAC
jgi:glycosyltransferase involved in cell wall biosynthesis